MKGVLLVVWLMLACCSVMQGQCAAIRSNPLIERVPEFTATDTTLVGVLLRLGQVARVPIGIEYVDRRALTEPVSVKLGVGTSLEQALNQILSQESGYSWHAYSGVIVISNAKGHNFPTLLDQVLPTYDLPRATTLEQANAVLYMDIVLVQDPSIRGFAGEYSPANTRPSIAPIRLSNVTVRDVLNHLVRCDGSAAWIVHAPASKMAQLPKNGQLWLIVPYNESRKYDYVNDQLLPSFPN